MANICVNCQHHLFEDAEHKCYRNQEKKSITNLVTGIVLTTTKGEPLLCEVERMHTENDKLMKRCGEEGKFFEAKPTTNIRGYSND